MIPGKHVIAAHVQSAAGCCDAVEKHDDFLPPHHLLKLSTIFKRELCAGMHLLLSYRK
jgi:hypothetical protein